MVDYQATKPIQHGGNQAAIRARLKLGNRPLLDFSAPLNALGPPPGALAAVREATESIDRYPEPGSPRLIERLAEYHGVPADRIIVGAGTTELISPDRPDLPRVAGPPRPRAGRPRTSRWPTWSEPTYGEYRRTSAQNGLTPGSGASTPWDGSRTTSPRGPAGIFWTGHPNNPTGRAWDRPRGSWASSGGTPRS